MPPAAAGRRAGRRIRAQLLRRGALRAVISLPQGAVPNMAVALTVWVLRRPLPDERTPGQILMIDTSEAKEDFAAPAAELWRRFSADPEADLDRPGLGRAVRIIDLLDEEVDLLPARHVTRPPAVPAIEQVTGLRTEVVRALEELGGLLPEVRPAQDGFGSPLVTVAEMARMGMLEILGPPATATAQPSAPPTATERPADSGGWTVLTTGDVTNGAPPSGDATDLTEHIPVRAGDVVVPTTAREPVARVITEDGALLGRHLILLRPDPDRLDPHFLAGMIRGARNHKHYSVLSSTYRIDARRAELPLLPLSDQHRYGEVFRRLEEFRTTLHRAFHQGTALAALITDGLVDASLHPSA